MATTALNHTISDNIRAEMAARRMSTETFARRLGISRETAYRRLAGQRSWMAEEVVDAAALFGVSVDQLSTIRAGAA